MCLLVVDKNQVVDTLNIENLESDDEPIGKRLTSSIANRLKKRKGKDANPPRLPRKVMLWVLLKV